MANNKLITSNFRLNNVKQFIESIDEPANTIYYVFGGKPSQYSLGDNVIDAPNGSVESLLSTVYDEMVFAKQITRSDVAIMVNRYDWTTGTVYDMYDSSDGELSTKQYFVVSAESGFYSVFKCLFNNDGGTSTSQPTYSEALSEEASGGYYETSDGYIWKYLFKIDATTYRKFTSQNFIPFVEDANVTSNSISGTIDVIQIDSVGKQYNNFISGSFISSDTKYGGNSLKYRITADNASTTDHFYLGCIIKIIDGVGIGQYREITDYLNLSDGKFIFVDTPFTTVPVASSYEIMPKINVYGDDRQTVNAAARALINSAASNSVYKIDILNRGEGYFYAVANVYAYSAVRTANSVNDANLKPMIAPRGGHGFDVPSELYSTHLGISVKFSNTENDTISTDNDFRTVGILKDPEFNSVKINYNNKVGTDFVVSEEAYQIDLRRLSGDVIVNANSKNIVATGTLSTITVANSGNIVYANTDTVYVSNVYVNAVCNLVTAANGSLISVGVVTEGFGLSTTDQAVIYAANSTGGNVRYFDSSILVGLSASANGLTYSNSDYIEVSSPSSTINATANIITNSTGGILTVTISNSGRGFSGFSNTFVVKIANSTGGYSNGSKVYSGNVTYSGTAGLYSNTDYIIFPSPTISHGNAVANLVTVVDGSLSTITVNAGNNYGFVYGANIEPYVANSTGGKTRYFNSNIVSSVTISNSSPSYRIDSVSIDTAGTGYDSTKILRVDVVDGGIGYNSIANNVLFFTGGGGSAANATFVNNSLGKIISVSMVANGSGFTSVPTVSANATANGVGANLVAVLANSLIFTSSVGGYGAVGYFANSGAGAITSVAIANSGFGYTSAPTVSVASGTTGTQSVLTAVLAGGANNFATNDIISVTNGSINSTANITANSTLFATSASLTNSGKGFRANTYGMFVANSTAGNIRHLNNTAIKAILVNQGGYSGFTENTDILTISGGTINAIGNVVSSPTGNLISVSLTNSGKGFANHSALVISIANSGGGNVRVLNTYTVNTFTINDGGYNFSNTDYLIITGTVNATANITTSSTGTITGLNFTHRGSNIQPAYVSALSIISGGLSYSNADTITFLGVGTGANATLLTNSTGGIVQAYVRNGGINYATAPLVTINTGTGSGGNLVASVIRPSVLRIYNANNTPSNGYFADISFGVNLSANVSANLVYAPIANVALANAANVIFDISDSANLSFIANGSANLVLNLQNQTSFTSSLGANDYIYVESDTESQVLQVNSVTNSTHLTVKSFPLFTDSPVAISSANVRAHGTVSETSTGFIKLGHVTGFFSQGNTIYGVSSQTSGNITGISFNGVSKNGTTINQLFYYEITSQTGSFTADETLTSGTKTAKYHSGNSSSIFVTSQTGIFLQGDVVEGASGECTISSNPSYKYEGDLVRGSGDIIYLENIEPISRSNTRSETVKITVEF